MRVRMKAARAAKPHRQSGTRGAGALKRLWWRLPVAVRRMQARRDNGERYGRRRLHIFYNPMCAECRYRHPMDLGGSRYVTNSRAYVWYAAHAGIYREEA